jgi:hypothetical protein
MIRVVKKPRTHNRIMTRLEMMAEIMASCFMVVQR